MVSPGVCRGFTTAPDFDCIVQIRGGARCSPRAAESATRSARRRPDRGSSPCRPPRAWPRRRSDHARARRTEPRPCRRRGSSTRSATAATWARAIGAHRGPGQAARAAAEPRSAREVRVGSVPGASAIARSVLIRDTASAPPSCAACAQAATSAVLGVSFTISGLPVLRSHRPHDLLELMRVGPDVQPGLDVRAGHVELERRDLRALPRSASTSRENSSARGAHHVRDQRHRSGDRSGRERRR